MTPTKPMPAWLLQQLTDAGRIDTDGIHRRAHAALCSTCAAPVMVGLDGDIAALPATCDTTPITPLGEAIALILARPTYTIRWLHVRGYAIDRRDLSTIRAHPPGSQPDVAVLVEHTCGTSLPGSDLNIPAPPNYATSASDTPPF